jgi:anti-anti-sigma regulatory factor
MTAIHRNIADTLLIAPGDLHELVRGQEREFVERMAPIVRKQSVTLDFAQIERVDAAGISALITLYGCAKNAGKNFAVINAAAHVVEVLAVVGLDRILILPGMMATSQTAQCFAQPAA